MSRSTPSRSVITSYSIHYTKLYDSIGHLGFTGTSLWIDPESEAIVVFLTNRVHLVAKKSRYDLRPLPASVRADVEALVGCIAGAVLVEERNNFV